MPPPSPSATSFTKLVLEDLRETWWIYPVIPIALTLLNLDGYGGTGWALSLLVNACATLSIGVTTQAIFVLSARRGWTLPYGLHYPVLILVGVGLGTELTIGVLGTFVNFNPSNMRVGMWLIGATVAALVAGLSLTYEHLRARARAVELREEQAQRQALQARLDALQSRMNPHFLFNSLNTVAALIEEDPAAAVEAVERLSELLRYTLERSEDRLVPLADELDCVREYLALERARFGERLRASIEIADPELERLALPPLTIQPLVENAIKHGVAPSREPVHVRIEVSRWPDPEGDPNGEPNAAPAGLRVEVRDDGPGSSATGLRTQGTGMAHATLRARLRLLYGERARFEAGPARGPERGYLARLELPADVLVPVSGPVSGPVQEGSP